MRIERLITDNTFAYGHGKQLRRLLAANGIAHKFIRPQCPWQNGKLERFNRTLGTQVGLQADLHQQRRTDRSVRAMCPHVQHSTKTHSTSWFSADRRD